MHYYRNDFPGRDPFRLCAGANSIRMGKSAHFPCSPFKRTAQKNQFLQTDILNESHAKIKLFSQANVLTEPQAKMHSLPHTSKFHLLSLPFSFIIHSITPPLISHLLSLSFYYSLSSLHHSFSHLLSSPLL